MSAKIWSSAVGFGAQFLRSPRDVATSAFSPPSPFFVRPSSSRLRPSSVFARENANDELILSLLGDDAVPADGDPYSRYTHQIAVPLADASELNSALRDIQTSLVRDCPRLVRACIVPALLRLPLLYVDGSSLQASGGGILGGGGNDADAILEQVVQDAIQEVVYAEDGAAGPVLLPFRGLELQGEDNSVLYAVGNNVNDNSDETKNKYEDCEEDGVYIVDEWASGVEPSGPSGWEMLEALVLNIQNKLESTHGLKTCWPLDKPQGEEIEHDDPMIAAIKHRQRKWRPRVPFVRLPKDFYQDLKADTEKRNRNKSTGNTGDEEEDELPSIIDMGYDGISPLFWYEAWGSEDILSPPGVRMRSVAVYRRMVPGGGESESSFYVPTTSDGPEAWKGGNKGAGGDQKSGISMELPAGDTEREKREKAKAMDRLGEIEQRAEREWEEGKARWLEELNDQRGNGNDEMSLLEEDDYFAPFDVGMDKGEVTVQGDAAYSAPWSERDVDEDIIASWKEKEIDSLLGEEPSAAFEKEQVVQKDSDPETPQQVVKPRRDLPSIEDNPVFQRLWEGRPQETSKGQNTAVALDGTPPTEDAPFPPYPSNAHFVGAWRVITSPLETENIPTIEDAESKSSDNFILRVDGQIMGGPILDARYQHKAAGGEWKMFQAVRKSTSQISSEEGYPSAPPMTQTRLRIRLLVPPEKNRALVMEGEVTRLVMPGADGGAATSSSPSEGWMMASGGMLDGMLQNLNDAKSSQLGAKGAEGLLYCGGEAWMEDVEGGTNRKKLGPFSLMKLKTIDRKNLIYTVDVSRPINEDGEEEGEVRSCNEA